MRNRWYAGMEICECLRWECGIQMREIEPGKDGVDVIVYT